MDLRSAKSPARALVRAVFDSVTRDVRYGCRTLLRAPLGAATIIVTVGLGLGLVAGVYTILNAMIFRVDDVRNPHELFGIERRSGFFADPRSERTIVDGGPGASRGSSRLATAQRRSCARVRLSRLVLRAACEMVARDRIAAMASTCAPPGLHPCRPATGCTAKC